MRTVLTLALIVVGARGTELPQPPDVSGYPELPSDPQRAGDPSKGYDDLVNGGYITCGIPRSAYDRVFGATDPEITGRTGANATLPYNFSAATSKEGVPVVSANCLTCHAGNINGQLVVGLGAADGDFTSDQMASYVDAAGSLITDPTEKAEWQRFDDRLHAIAPYVKTLTSRRQLRFHDGSVPTLEAVLDSSKRPKYWVRTSYDSTDFDPVAVGWTFTAISHGQAWSRPRPHV